TWPRNAVAAVRADGPGAQAVDWKRGAGVDCGAWLSTRLMARSDGGESHQGARGMPESGRIAARANPPRGRFRNHLPVDTQVPAGLGTAKEQTARFAPSGCPGVFGPVPQPV